MQSAFPEGVSVKYLSRGFLPTFASQYIYPIIVRFKGRMWRHSRPLRILYSKFRRLIRLARWRIKRIWNLRIFYFKKIIWFITRIASVVAKFISLIKRLSSKLICILLIQPIKFILSILITYLVEWPTAVFLGIYSFRPKKTVYEDNPRSLYGKITNQYYKLSEPFYLRRLEQIQKNSPNTKIELIE